MTAVAQATYTIRPLDETTWDAFAALVEHNNGVFGGCWCIGFHPEGGDRETTYETNRALKLERVRRGPTHAALAFDGDDCLGWCQFGGGTVEGYPEDAASVPAGFLFHGALSTYERLGFTRHRMIGKHRWVMTRVVEGRRAT